VVPSVQVYLDISFGTPPRLGNAHTVPAAAVYEMRTGPTTLVRSDGPGILAELSPLGAYRLLGARIDRRIAQPTPGATVVPGEHGPGPRRTRSALADSRAASNRCSGTGPFCSWLKLLPDDDRVEQSRGVHDRRRAGGSVFRGPASATVATS